jgi:hypothetical protein
VTEGRRAAGRVGARILESVRRATQSRLASPLARDRARYQDEAGALRLHVRTRRQERDERSLREAEGAGPGEADVDVSSVQGAGVEPAVGAA